MKTKKKKGGEREKKMLAELLTAVDGEPETGSHCYETMT